ncbi:FAD-dependent oxidoreductase [Micromonospora sp. WMMD987]|uniref:FAD-dependent oxidoreductase n=1 Tax=Micromonospora sp. WMMD987 TaxID=3016089 RepID=UPI00249B493B|nr:FAD-dependent oxidoreductase [Micromonospora sp. WMMD987]WFE94105.1 FAD-dependent oxidoreductase [Micromonospora sp. WMMD987]
MTYPVVHDVVVIGGGAAGLSGALALGRFRRDVVVVDGGAPRNAPADHVHNFLTSEGMPPAELYATGRAEVARYGVTVLDGTVTATHPADASEPAGDAGPARFAVTLSDGRTLHARRLLVTTGLVDELPGVPGLADRWGRDVLHCPYCHGWEVRDRAVGVLATGPLAAHQALLFRQLTDDVVVFTHTAGPVPADEAEKLAARGVTVVDGEVAAVEVDADRLTGVRLRSGRVLPREALVVAPTFDVRATFLAGLGLATEDFGVGGYVLGTRLASDATGATAVPGVWAAGNVTDPQATVIAAAAAGLKAAAALNADLIDEDTTRAVAAHRAAAATGVPATDRPHHTATPGAGRPAATPVGAGADGDPTVDEETARHWDELYRGRERQWSGRPNPHLVDVVGTLPAGTALDLGCGEGGDAVWLARRGWRVTAVDVSTTALERSAAAVTAAGVASRVEFRRHDLARSFPTGAFDLVSAQFLQSPLDFPRTEVLRAAARAVAPGGRLLVVEHGAVPPWGNPAHRHLRFPTPQETLADLDLDPDRWHVERLDAPQREATGPGGQTATLVDHLLLLRRR